MNLSVESEFTYIGKSCFLILATQVAHSMLKVKTGHKAQFLETKIGRITRETLLLLWEGK